jgi:aryl-alcohol dehydrogenase-like predicted oxidoreductase
MLGSDDKEGLCLNKRALGNSSLAITPLMLGGNVFGWTADEATSFEILDAFVAQGGNAIDTADGYSYWVPGNKGGESETVIGKWLKRRGKRDDVVIGTKVGWWDKRKGLARQNVIDGCEDSLRRLGVDTIDSTGCTATTSTPRPTSISARSTRCSKPARSAPSARRTSASSASAPRSPRASARRRSRSARNSPSTTC